MWLVKLPWLLSNSDFYTALHAIIIYSFYSDQPSNVECDAPLNSYSNWSCDQVSSWLSEQVKLDQYSSVFRDNEIDGAELNGLTSQVLQKDLGIGEKSNIFKFLLFSYRISFQHLWVIVIKYCAPSMLFKRKLLHPLIYRCKV